MQIHVPYGKHQQTVTLPNQRLAGLIHPNEVESGSEFETLQDALAHPMGTVSFREFVAAGGATLILVNDGTRPTPTAKVLDIIASDLLGADVGFIIATGSHRAPTDEELRLIFGKHLDPYREIISIHDSKANDDMVYVGTSERGNEIWMNRRIIEADRLVVIGSVEPHYFAGYTGGRKAFLPGVASFRSIEQNHKLALRPEAASLALAGNPVHEETVEVVEAIETKPIFSIQVVLDRDRHIYAATAGDIHESFYAAVKMANDVFCVPVEEKADVVLAVARYPMDVDLYQSQKALEHGKLVVKRGGILILVSKCPGGIGDTTFYDLLSERSTLHEILAEIDGGYRLGYHKAAKIAEIGTWADVWAVTDLPAETVKNVRLRPFPSVQEAVTEALKVKGPEAMVLFLMDGSITVPMLC